MTTVEVLAKMDKYYNLAQVMDPSFHRSLTDRTDDLFEAMKMSEHDKKMVMLQVRNDDTQYWAIRQILKDLYPHDGDHELKAVGFGDGADGKLVDGDGGAKPVAAVVQQASAPATTTTPTTIDQEAWDNWQWAALGYPVPVWPQPPQPTWYGYSPQYSAPAYGRQDSWSADWSMYPQSSSTYSQMEAEIS